MLPARCVCYLPDVQTVQTRSGFQHLLVLGTMLIAHCLAVGTPVWHVLAHALRGEHTEHHAEHVGGATVEQHEDIHPPQLHERGVVASASAPLLVFFVPARPWLSDTPDVQSVVPIRRDAVLRSRGPPPGDPARAPPFA